MAIDKEKVLLWAGGVLASAAVAFLIYRLQQQDAAQNAANAANAAAEEQSELANQQAETASLPEVSVPSITSTPSTTTSPTDTANQSQTPSDSSTLEAFLATVLAEDSTPVTSQSSNTGNMVIPVLPPNVAPTIDPVIIPTVDNFGGTPTASPISTAGGGSLSNTTGANGYNTNVARG